MHPHAATTKNTAVATVTLTLFKIRINVAYRGDECGEG
jgi:hypothetical protein